MFSLEMISKKTSETLSSELKLDDDKREIIAYGIFAILQMIYNLLLVIIFGMIFNVVIEALIVSFTISILRKSSGGIHASSPNICALIGTMVSILVGLFSKIEINKSIYLLIVGIVFVWSFYIIYKLAPVDSPAKPIKKVQKIARLKKMSIVTLCIYLVIVSTLIIIFFNTNYNNVISYSSCILGGVIWQVLSITRIAHRMSRTIDAFFNNIKKRKRGENNEENK